MERINVRVDERLKQELEAEAREKGVSPSDIVPPGVGGAHAAADTRANLPRHRQAAGHPRHRPRACPPT